MAKVVNLNSGQGNCDDLSSSANSVCDEGGLSEAEALLANCPGYRPINHYGLIGDLHTAALVGPDGSIDWCCLPIFDSDSVFAKILDSQNGGAFYVRPAGVNSGQLRYFHKTNILANSMSSKVGGIELIDYMPVQHDSGAREDVNAAYLCRHIECTKGIDVEIEIGFFPRPGYGEHTQLEYFRHGAVAQDVEIKLLSTVPIVWDENGVGKVTMSHGDSARLVLCYGPTFQPRNLEAWADQQLLQTRQFWENWLGQCIYKGRWRGMVERSALTLKLLTFHPTGAIIAAPTTSLPETLGGERNWDYRFSWLRDSALILNALMPLGFKDEAKAYFEWMLAQCPQENQPMPILYSISDVDTTEERELPQFEGYCGSGPVRIGNAACDQVQLDVYGEVLDALYIYSEHAGALDQQQLEYVIKLATRICAEWREKDEGIWEVRGDKQHFTYSKLMCWAGLDRAIRIASASCDAGNADIRIEVLKDHLDRWRSVKEEIRTFILQHCVDKSKQYLTQSDAAVVADASNLMASIVGFLDPQDPIILNTLDQTLEQLTSEQLVFRYLNDDGLEGEEGAFNICSFWLVEALALSGRNQQACEIFDGLLELSSGLGLYAEETEVNSKIALGNFPQAFSHVGLINAAILLNQNARSRRIEPFWAKD